MFEAYITNTALYPLMGIEVGTTVHFPMTTQELQAALAKIGIDGKRYSEVFFTSFDSDVLGLYDYLYECENIDELNELGHALLEVRDKGGLETFEAALVLGNHTRSVKDLINLTQNLDLYRFYPDISDDEGLGRLYADELGTIDIPEHIQNYFDYEAYGRDVRINDADRPKLRVFENFYMVHAVPPCIMFWASKKRLLPAACVHIVIYLRRVVVAHGGGGVEQHGQQVLLHVADFG